MFVFSGTATWRRLGQYLKMTKLSTRQLHATLSSCITPVGNFIWLSDTEVLFELSRSTAYLPPCIAISEGLASCDCAPSGIGQHLLPSVMAMTGFEGTVIGLQSSHRGGDSKYRQRGFGRKTVTMSALVAYVTERAALRVGAGRVRVGHPRPLARPPSSPHFRIAEFLSSTSSTGRTERVTYADNPTESQTIATYR